LHGRHSEAFSPWPGKGSKSVARLPLTRFAHANQSATVASAAVQTRAHGAARGAGGRQCRRSAGDVSVVRESGWSRFARGARGATALEVAEQFKPEVVLLDLSLPGMDGFQLAHELRKRGATANALLTAVTGYGQPGDRQHSLDAGFEDHLVNPISSQEIEQAIVSRFAVAQRQALTACLPTGGSWL
jgi:CheY-like chemotaxis protein